MLGLCITAYAVPDIAKYLYSGWKDIKWDYSKVLILVVVLEAAFPISDWLIKLMHVIFPSSTENTKDKKVVTS
jgi:hypothetical protein